jgi:hypothetical protein
VQGSTEREGGREGEEGERECTQAIDKSALAWGQEHRRGHTRTTMDVCSHTTPDAVTWQGEPHATAHETYPTCTHKTGADEVAMHPREEWQVQALLVRENSRWKRY